MKPTFLSLLIAALVCACSQPTPTTNTANSTAVKTPQSTPSPSTTPSTSAPVDEGLQQLLLTQVNTLQQANASGDSSGILNYTTEDYVIHMPGGKTITRKEMLADLRPIETLEKVTCTEPEMKEQTATSAVLQYTLRMKMKDGKTGIVSLSSSFVKIGANWKVKDTTQLPPK